MIKYFFAVPIRNLNNPITKLALSIFLIFLSTGIKAQTNELIKNGNTYLNVKIYSNDNPETVILLHGGPGYPDDMIEVVEILKGKFRVVTFEQRGVGASKCSDCSFTMQAYISDIDAIVKYLNISEFYLFGHSWGGLYAQIYAAENPNTIQSLFLCSPSSGTNETWKRTEKEVMQYNKNHSSNTEWLMMGWNSFLGMLGSDKAYGRLFKQVLKNYNKNYTETVVDESLLKRIHSKPINRTRKEIVKYKPLEEFTNPNYPVIIIYGEDDIYGESKNELIKRFPIANIQNIEKSGHIPWLHNPAKFEIILKTFYKL